MPMRSEAQRRYLHAHKPEMAKRWEEETGPGKLPEHAPPKDTKKKAPTRRRKRRG